jgi:hypothetical protein
MEQKLECSLAEMRKQDINTSSINEKLGELSAKIAFAKNDLRQARENNLAGNFTFAQTKTIAAQNKLDEAYLNLKDIVKEIKLENGMIIDCSTDNPGLVTTIEED